MSAGGPEGSGRALRLDPFALPVRYAAPDNGADGQTRHIELGRDRVVMRREVRGMSMKVGVPVANFRGVSLRLRPAASDAAATAALTLEHRDAGLCVPLLISAEVDEVIALWKSWGRVLGLPLLSVDGDGIMREPFPRLGMLEIRTPAARRRRRGAIKKRRPSILLRRKPGSRGRPMPVHRGEREIIARN
jgi:hypothetical protein